MNRYLVCFTTPVAGGWSTGYPEAWAIVLDREGTMPYGWQPEKIGELYVQEVKWIIPLDASMSQITLISGEYDKEVELPGDGSPVIINDAAFGLVQPSVFDELDGTAAPIPGEYLTSDDVAPLDPAIFTDDGTLPAERYRKD